MELSKNEARMIQRRRSRWHTFMRRAWHVVSILCVVVAVTLLLILASSAIRQRDYWNTISVAPLNTSTDSAVFVILASQYVRSGLVGQEEQLIAQQLRLFRHTLDTLELSGVVLGFDLNMRVVPFRSFNERRCISSL